MMSAPDLTLPDTAAGGPAGAATDRLLDIQDLSVAFGRTGRWTTVVDGVSLSVSDGEVVGLVGESGSGKSVTCQSAIGLIGELGGRIVGGTVRVNGQDVTHATEKQWRAIRPTTVAMIFQQPIRSLNPAYTVGDQIAETLRIHKGMRRRQALAEAVELLDLVRIADAARRVHDYPHMLSGGMCQRVMIAIALACRPRLLIADEPTTALDVTVQKGVLDLLRELQAEMGLAVLYVSHDLAIVEEMCDRVVVMYAGQVVEQAPVQALFSDPRHPYTRGLLASTPVLGQGRTLGFIPGAVPPGSAWPAGCRFHPRCGHAVDGPCTAAPIPLAAAGRARYARCARLDDLHGAADRHQGELS